MKRIGVYRITNKSSGKSYVGQSIDINRRWRIHLRDSVGGPMVEGVIK